MFSLLSERYSLTGELLTTNVYLTSAFPEGAKLGAILEAKQRASGAIANKEKLKNLRGVAPTGFDLNISCAMKMDQIVAGMASQIDILKSNPNFLERAQTDIVRFVTAHEVGHTIGLRHNFAGSLANEFDSWQQEDDAFTQYLADPNSVGGATSSSVMDYLDDKDILLGGSRIKTAELSYDNKAVDWGYKNGENIIGNLMGTKDVLFCSDLEAHSGAVMDCVPFDSGKDPVLNSIYNAGKVNKTLMSIIFEIVLEMKFGNAFGGSHLTFQEIFSSTISPEELSQQSASDFSAFQKAMTSNGRFLSLNRKFGGSAWGNNKSKYFSALTDKQSKEFEELGGIVGMIEKVVPTDAEHKVKKGWLVEQVQKIIASPNFTSGKTLSGVDYTLNASDKEYIQETLLDFANRYEENYLGSTLEILAPTITTSESFNVSLFGMSSNSESGATPYNYKLPIDSWTNDLSEFVQNIITTTENDQLILSEGTIQYAMPKPKHSLNTRLAAIKLLSEKLYGKTSFLKDLKTSLIKAEKERIGNALYLIIPTSTVPSQPPVPSAAVPNTTASTIGSVAPAPASAPSVAITATTPTLPSSSDVFKKIKGLSTPEIKAWALKELAVLKSLEDLDTAETATTAPTSVSEIKKYIPDDYKE